MNQDRHMLMVDDNVGNQFRENAVQNVRHLVGQGMQSESELSDSPAEGNGNGINGNPIRCYNCRGEGHYASNCTVKLMKRDVAYLQTKLQIAQKDEDNLQQASTSGTQSDKAPVNDSDGSAEGEGTVEQHSVTVEETRVYHESLFQNLAAEVEKVNSVNRKMKETNADLTTKLARYKDQERVQNFKIQFLKEAAKFVRDFKSLAKEADESLARHKALELEIKRLLGSCQSGYYVYCAKRMNMLNFGMIGTKSCEECKYDKISYDKAYNDMQQKIERLQAQLGDLKGKSKDTPCVSDTLDPLSQKLENENVELEFQVQNYEKENAHLKTAYKNLFDSINVIRTQTKTIIDSLQTKLHDTIYENAKLISQLFDKVSKQGTPPKDYVNGMKSRKKNQSANVSKSENQKKHKPRVWKPKKVGSKERLASPKPSTPRSCLRWSPIGRMFDLKGKIIATSESECQSDCFKGDNACTSNHRNFRPDKTISNQLSL
ncbi:retrovirus-related pol polyprotein from transposon TNT 1-94 [Tanacetum coccineum]